MLRHFIQTYGAIKEAAKQGHISPLRNREYFDVISPWERRFLLLHV